MGFDNIGPAAAGSAGPVPTPLLDDDDDGRTSCFLSLLSSLSIGMRKQFQRDHNIPYKV